MATSSPVRALPPGRRPSSWRAEAQLTAAQERSPRRARGGGATVASTPRTQLAAHARRRTRRRSLHHHERADHRPHRRSDDAGERAPSEPARRRRAAARAALLRVACRREAQQADLLRRRLRGRAWRGCTGRDADRRGRRLDAGGDAAQRAARARARARAPRRTVRRQRAARRHFVALRSSSSAPRARRWSELQVELDEASVGHQHQRRRPASAVSALAPPTSEPLESGERARHGISARRWRAAEEQARWFAGVSFYVTRRKGESRTTQQALASSAAAPASRARASRQRMANSGR